MQQLEAAGVAAGAFLCPEDDEAALQSDATLPEYDEEEEMLEFDPWSFIKGLPPLADCVPAFRKALLPCQTRRSAFPAHRPNALQICRTLLARIKLFVCVVCLEACIGLHT